jgi:hypothetical protein
MPVIDDILTMAPPPCHNIGGISYFILNHAEIHFEDDIPRFFRTLTVGRPDAETSIDGVV